MINLGTTPGVSFGPPANAPKTPDTVPFAMYSRSTPLGRVADWNLSARQQKWFEQFSNSQINPAFNYGVAEDESAFKVIDTKQKTKQTNVRRPFVQKARAAAPVAVEPPTSKGRSDMPRRSRRNARWNRYWDGGSRNNWKDRVEKEPSIRVNPDWDVCHVFEFAELLKANVNVKEPEDLASCGKLEYYDTKFDKVSTRANLPLERVKRTCLRVTTSEDPLIQKMAKEDAGTVFCTDSILASLMCVTRSVNSFDFCVERVGNKLFIDRRADAETDYFPVNETSHDAPTDDCKDPINVPKNLAKEAMFVNENFSQQILVRDANKKTLKFGKELSEVFSLDEGEETQMTAFRYRRWELPGDLQVVCRTRIDGALPGNVLFRSHALTEYDLKAAKATFDWRKDLEAQRGAVLAAEIKNNASRLAKWSVSAALSGCEQVRLGFVSRVKPNDPYQHRVLGVHSYTAANLNAQMNLMSTQTWGIISRIASVCLKQPEGKYLLLRDANKPLLHLYRIGDVKEEAE